MWARDRKWKEPGDIEEGAKVILPEHLMPVALMAVEVVKKVFDDHTIFVSPKFEKHRAKVVHSFLEWAHESVSKGEVNDVRELFDQGGIEDVLPFTTISDLPTTNRNLQTY